jgi:hypothetical protein
LAIKQHFSINEALGTAHPHKATTALAADDELTANGG